MAFLSETVRNWFSGVSQQPQNQRGASHLNEQINAMVYQGRALGRRPPTYHVATLGATVGTPYTIPITRSIDEKYEAVIQGGEIQVFNKFTGAEMTVETPDGVSYLTTALEGYRHLTVGDRTVIVNRGTTVAKGTTTSPEFEELTLVVVRQGNFGTNYTVTIDGTSVTHTTPKSTVADAEENITTDVIATELATLLAAEGAFSGVFSFLVAGSTIQVTPVVNGTVYEVTTSDGLGDDGLSVLRGSVQRFSDLPTQAPDGAILEVRGDETTKFDNFWVEYDAATSVWTETVAPECLLGFDKSTMPHLLEYKGRFMDKTEHEGTASTEVFTNSTLSLVPNSLLGRLCKNITDGSQGIVLSNTSTTVTTTPLASGGSNLFREGDEVEVVGFGTYFVFRQGPWADRTVGDTITNPYPSFVGNTIRDVSVTSGRLGIVAPNAIVLSRTADLFNLFRKTVTIIEPDGPIDMTETLPSSSKFHALTDWDGSLIAWTDLAQYEISSNGPLTPDTVTITRLSQYPNISTCRPVASGPRVYFAGLHNGLTRIMELIRRPDTDRAMAQSITTEIPTYIVGSPFLMDADETAGLLLVLTREESETYLYAFTHVLAPETGERLQQAWGRWVIGSPVANYATEDIL